MNEQNLIPGAHKLTVEEQSRGGNSSARSRRRKRDMKAKMKMLLSLPCSDTEEWNEASAMGVDMSEIDNETVMLIGLLKQAKIGNVQAVREVRNIVGTDNSSAELEIKKKELKLKEDAVSVSEASPEASIAEAWIESVLGGDENEE